MIVNYGIATVEEFMFCTWPHIRMEGLFLQFIKNKLSSLGKFPQLNYIKTLNEKFPPLTCPVWIPAPVSPLPCKWGGKCVQCMHYVMKFKIFGPLPLHWSASSLQWVSFLLHTSRQDWYIKTFFRKARHECAMSKKRHILINLGQFADEMPLAFKIKVAGVRKMLKEIQSRHTIPMRNKRLK